MNKKIILASIVLILIGVGGWFVYAQVMTQEQDVVAFFSQQTQVVASDSHLSIENAHNSLIGSWQSADDPRDHVTYRADGSWEDTYEGSPSATARGQWITLSTLSHEPKEQTKNIALPADTTGVFLKKTDKYDTALYYSIAGVDSKTLWLIYLDAGNSLRYVKMQ